MQHTQQAGEQGFVAGGKRIAVDCEVRTWLETGLQFRGRPARKLSELVVLHWTGAENPPSAVHRNMIEVGYAVHFVVDQFGIAWQMLDTDRLGAHAKGVNDRAIGIEIICRGDDKKVPTRGVERLERTEVIQGREVTYAAFTGEQEATAVALVTALCQHYRLPLELPPCDGALNKAGLRRFPGVIGHLHTKATKNDPGLYLLQRVRAHCDTIRGGGGGYLMPVSGAVGTQHDLVVRLGATLTPLEITLVLGSGDPILAADTQLVVHIFAREADIVPLLTPAFAVTELAPGPGGEARYLLEMTKEQVAELVALGTSTAPRRDFWWVCSSRTRPPRACRCSTASSASCSGQPVAEPLRVLVRATVALDKDTLHATLGSTAQLAVQALTTKAAVVSGVLASQGIAGPPGPPGPQGEQGGTVDKLSTGPLSAVRIVRAVDAEHIEAASALVRAHAYDLIGVSITSAAAAEETVRVVCIGEVEDGSWAFTPHQLVFVGAGGALTQVIDPAWPFLCRVGVAISPTKVFVQLHAPTFLAAQ